MIDLSEKRAIVTGARGGLGAAVAKELALAGASVAVGGRNPGDCGQTVAEAESAGGRMVEVAIDMLKLQEIEIQVESALQKLGGVDIIVNNAAVIEPMAPMGKIDSESFDMACRINLTGPMAVVNAVWDKFAGGRVLNVLSGAAINPVHGWSAYCSTKAGLHMLTRMIDMEGEPNGIRGFGFAPGLVDTNMQNSIRAAKINRISDIPKDQLTPPDIPAKMMVWLVSGEADDLSGQMVDIRDPEIQKRYGGPVGGN